MQKLDRNQLVALVGEEAVRMVENEPCEPTSRLIYPEWEGHHMGCSEWVANVRYGNYIVSAYYFPKDGLFDENGEYMAEWEIEYYTLD